MPGPLLTIIAGTFFSNVARSILSSLLPSNDGQTMESFIRILSRDISAKIEDVVRMAFLQDKFITIESKLLSSLRGLREYECSEHEDSMSLLRVYNDISEASALLAVIIGHLNITFQAHINEVPDRYDTKKVSNYKYTQDYKYWKHYQLSDKRKDKISQNNRYLAIIVRCMDLLDQIAAFDILILAARSQRLPALARELTSKCEDYQALANTLIRLYTDGQKTIITLKFIAFQLPGLGQHLQLKSVVFKDDKKLFSDSLVLGTGTLFSVMHDPKQKKKMKKTESKFKSDAVNFANEEAEKLRNATITDDCIVQMRTVQDRWTRLQSEVHAQASAQNTEQQAPASNTNQQTSRTTPPAGEFEEEIYSSTPTLQE